MSGFRQFDGHQMHAQRRQCRRDPRRNVQRQMFHGRDDAAQKGHIRVQIAMIKLIHDFAPQTSPSAETLTTMPVAASTGPHTLMVKE